MNIEKLDTSNIDNESSKLQRIKNEALRNRETYQEALNACSSTTELIQVLRKFSYIDIDGVEVTPSFMKEGEEYVVDVETPLEVTLDSIEKYNRGELSEQQLYTKLGLNYAVIGAIQKIAGVKADYSDIKEIYIGNLPSDQEPKNTIEGQVNPEQKKLE